MNKSEREPPKVLAYQIWNHSDLRFWRRSRKYQFWLKMTQNIHQKYKIQDIDTKWTNLRNIHPRYLHVKYETILSCGLGEEDENVIVNGRRTISNMTSSTVSSSMTAELKTKQQNITLLKFGWKYTQNHKYISLFLIKINQFKNGSWIQLANHDLKSCAEVHLHPSKCEKWQNIHQKYKIWDIDLKWTNLRKNHPKYLYIKYQSTQATGFQEEDENVIVDGQTTDNRRTDDDDGQSVILTAPLCHLRWQRS